MTLKKLVIFCIIAIVLSCSSDNNGDDFKESENNNFRLTSVQFPTDQALSAVSIIPTRSINYKYDLSNKISQISTNGSVYSVDIISNNLFELNLLEHDLGDEYTITIKRSIHLQNNLVEYIKSESEFFNSRKNTLNYYTDSISYSYADGYISKIESYSKNSSKYELKRTYEYQIKDGNVSKIIDTYVGIKNIRKFNYDTKTKVDFSEFAYRSPLYPENFLDYILIHDKMGKQNINNVSSVFCTYDEDYLKSPQIESVEYAHIFSTNGNIKNIEMSGTVIYSKDDTNYPKSFSNVRTSMVYEKY